MTDAPAPLTEAALAAIEARAAKATPGPWIADELFMEGNRCTRVSTTDGSPTYYHHCASICEAHTTEDDDETPKISVLNAEWNAAFIAAARTDIPALLAEVRRLREALADWQECAQYDATMEGPKYKGWDISALNRCRVKHAEEGSNG